MNKKITDKSTESGLESKEGQHGQSQQQHHFVMASIPDTIIQCDPSGRIEFINRALPGHATKDVIGTRAADWVPPAYKRQMEDLLSRVAGTGEPEMLGIEVAEDNRSAWHLHRVYPVKNEDAIAGLTIAVTDITPLRLRDRSMQVRHITGSKNVEDALMISDQAIKTSVTAFVFADLEGKITFANQAFLDMWGYESIEEIIGMSNTELGYSREKIHEIMQELMIHGHWLGEDVAKKKDGTPFDVYLSASVVTDEQNVPICTLASVVDITEQKRSHEYTQAIVDTTVDGIITIDERGIIQSFNKAAERMFKYGSQEVIGRNVNILMPSPYQEEHDGYIRNYLDTGKHKIIGIGREVVGLRKDGDVFPMELAVSEINIGKSRLFTGLVRDISDRRRMELEILRISEEERQNIGQELHDGLGSHLSGLHLIAQNIARRLEMEGHPMTGELIELSAEIKEADYQARSISRGLVPVAPEGGGLVLALQRLAESAHRTYGVVCTFDGEVQMEDNNVSTHLFRIAQEAFINAVRHGKATEVSIRLDLEEDATQLRLVIADNGIGIPDKLPEKRGVGLRTMKYRASVINARLTIERREEGGTIVACQLYWPQPESASKAVSSST